MNGRTEKAPPSPLRTETKWKPRNSAHGAAEQRAAQHREDPGKDPGTQRHQTFLFLLRSERTSYCPGPGAPCPAPAALSLGLLPIVHRGAAHIAPVPSGGGASSSELP